MRSFLSETTFLPYFMTARCVFFYQSVYFFTNGVYPDFNHNIRFLWFLWNSVGKKMHTLLRCGLIFPFQCHIFYTGFSVELYLHNWSPLKPQNKLQKKSSALPSSYCRGLRAPDPANPCSEKMTSQPTCFCRANFPKTVTSLHRLFNISCIKTHFDMFFKNLGMYGCHIFLGMC